MGFVKDHSGKFRENTGIRRAGLTQCKVREKEMVVHNDNVAFHGPATHLRDETAVPLCALLPGTAVRSRVKLGPELRGFRQFGQLRAIAALCVLLPGSNLAILLNLLQSGKNRLVGEIIEFLPAK